MSLTLPPNSLKLTVHSLGLIILDSQSQCARSRTFTKWSIPFKKARPIYFISYVRFYREFLTSNKAEQVRVALYTSMISRLFIAPPSSLLLQGYCLSVSSRLFIAPPSDLLLQGYCLSVSSLSLKLCFFSCHT